MKRRVLGAIVCIVVFAVSAATVSAQLLALNSVIRLQFEASFFALDPFDLGDSDYPDAIVNASARNITSFKLPVFCKIKMAKVVLKTFEPMQDGPRLISSRQDLYRQQEVFRI